MRCCVPFCTNRTRKSTGSPVRYHRFPGDADACGLWLRVMEHRLARQPPGSVRGSVKNLRVCGDHFTPEDYKQGLQRDILKHAAVPSRFIRRTQPLKSEAEDQDCSAAEEPSAALRAPDHKSTLAHQQRSAPASVLGHRTRSDGRRQKVFSEKENTPAPRSEVEEKSWRKAVKSLQTPQETSVFKSNEVLVNTQCLLELFQYCWLCQIECCITIEGHERQFSITQDCQSCGLHRQWRSHPAPAAEEPVEAFSTQHEEAASDPQVEHTLEPGDEENKEVVVQIMSSDNEGTDSNCEQMFIEGDGSYLSSSDEEPEQEDVEKQKKGKSRMEDSSDEWEPHLEEVATDSDASVDEDTALTEDSPGKVMMWCTVCKTDATLSCSLNRHRKVFACVQCGASDNIETHSFDKLVVHFEDFLSFQEHAEKEHGAKPLHKLCQECGKLITAEPKSTGGADHVCEHKSKPVVCPECGKRFLTEVGLKRHFSKLHKDADHPCKYCLKLFKNRPSKLEHEQTHPKEKQPYSCPDCPETFDNLYKRNSHLKLHRGPYKYACDTCGKRFRDIIKLKRHKLIHSGEKPFRCQVCNRSFNQIGNLSSHMRLHTGEKPYMCEQCGECFNHNVSLKNHLLRHHHVGLSQTEREKWQSDPQNRSLYREGC